MSSDDAPVLRAVEAPERSGFGTAGEPGLESLHAVLERIAADHGIESVAVVVDDADLGRQAFRAGPGPHPALDAEPGVHVAGDVRDGVDSLALHALSAASLRAAVLDGVVRGVASPELELRRIGGVCLVDLTDGEEPVVDVVVTADAPADVAHAVLETARRALDKPVAVVVERLAGPFAEPADAGETPSEAGLSEVELLMVHTTPETREIEVHLAYGDARSISRSPMAGAGGAVEATLRALRDRGMALHISDGSPWKVKPTTEPSFVVTVALHDVDSDLVSYGAAAGTTPIEAAARASLLAASRG